MKKQILKITMQPDLVYYLLCTSIWHCTHQNIIYREVCATVRKYPLALINGIHRTKENKLASGSQRTHVYTECFHVPRDDVS